MSHIVLAQKHPFYPKFSYQIETEMSEEKIQSSRAALLYSLIGDYHNSMQYSNSSVSWGVDSINLDSYSLENAVSNIVKEAKIHPSVIISKNHSRPQHRIFAKNLISELSKIGFDHLGLETLDNLDTNLHTRGYPLLDNPLTGVYTLEPQMGDLVRTAIALDMNLFGYEEVKKTKGKDRDEVQADNIILYLKNNPNSKLVLVCGFYHAIESDFKKYGTYYYMAKYLKDKLGIDPLTIYQDNFTERLSRNEHPYLKDLNIDAPSIFVNQSGEVVFLSEHVDIEVVHPKTTYINGRPSWLYQSKQYQPINVELRDFDVDFPIIVSAHPINELNSVPVDRIELKHRFDNKVLVLKTGEYKISIYDGLNTWEYNQIVE